jgi:hypothetical protein
MVLRGTPDYSGRLGPARLSRPSPGFRAPGGAAGPALSGIRDGHEVLVLETESYRLFVSLPIGFGAACRFAAALSERFDWFRRYAALPSDLSFPALLEYGP